ncbi:hypothetical protein [Nesterenkonia marinintestina]|uniref:hypothetical protein n=1 Tax=Nesterenkonia marinintestina TaxID=2979865 RepID=UPI0021C1C310|nr:hypothetical protein [Nesterenkonia sp. GX14115]
MSDTGTVEADHRRRAGVREPTAAELTTIAEHDYPAPPTGCTYWVGYTHTGGLHERRVLHGDAKGWSTWPAETTGDDDA